jgi:sulfur transfer complex TusBCD TusB component (DsrH family)
MGQGVGMTTVTLTITLDESDYVVLLNAAVLAGMGTPSFVQELVKSYLEDNYGAA